MPFSGPFLRAGPVRRKNRWRRPAAPFYGGGRAPPGARATVTSPDPEVFGNGFEAARPSPIRTRERHRENRRRAPGAQVTDTWGPRGRGFESRHRISHPVWLRCGQHGSCRALGVISVADPRPRAPLLLVLAVPPGVRPVPGTMKEVRDGQVQPGRHDPGRRRTRHRRARRHRTHPRGRARPSARPPLRALRPGGRPDGRRADLLRGGRRARRAVPRPGRPARRRRPRLAVRPAGLAAAGGGAALGVPGGSVGGGQGATGGRSARPQPPARRLGAAAARRARRGAGLLDRALRQVRAQAGQARHRRRGDPALHRAGAAEVRHRRPRLPVRRRHRPHPPGGGTSGQGELFRHALDRRHGRTTRSRPDWRRCGRAPTSWRCPLRSAAPCWTAPTPPTYCVGPR